MPFYLSRPLACSGARRATRVIRNTRHQNLLLEDRKDGERFERRWGNFLVARERTKLCIVEQTSRQDPVIFVERWKQCEIRYRRSESISFSIYGYALQQQARKMTEKVYSPLTANVTGRTHLLFHSRFIRYTSRFALCPAGRYAQRKAIPRRNLIKTIKLWKETSAEPSRSPGEKERKDKKRGNESTRLEARIRFSSPTFIFARFPLNSPVHPLPSFPPSISRSVSLPLCLPFRSFCPRRTDPP